MATAAETIAAIATKVFYKRNMKRAWGAQRALFQVLATDDLMTRKKEVMDTITPVKNTHGRAEAWKWPVSMTQPANGGAFARGGAFTYTVDDRFVSGEADTRHYAQPIVIPTTDIDVRANASDNENSVNYVLNQMNDAKWRLLELIADDVLGASTGANEITTLLELVDSTGTASGISQATHANWASTEVDLANARLTLPTLAKRIRDHRRSKGATLDVVVVGSGVHNLLVQEAEAKNQPVFDIVDHFGTRADGSKRLHLETSFSTIMVERAVILPDENLDANAPGTVLGLSLPDVFLVAAEKANFAIKGLEDVSVTAAVDQTRGLLRWSGFTGIANRRTHFKYVNAATA